MTLLNTFDPKTTEKTFSLVATIGLPNPPVVAVEPIRSKLVPACTMPAAPPPTGQPPHIPQSQENHSLAEQKQRQE